MKKRFFLLWVVLIILVILYLFFPHLLLWEQIITEQVSEVADKDKERITEIIQELIIEE